jgi:hypothetical protein
MHRVAITGVALGGWLLAGCDAYPPAKDIADCAAGRFGTGQGTFTVEERRSSWFAATEYAIAYQKQGSGDRAVVIYNRRNGPGTVQSDITFGNHAEIAGAVRAIELCAQPR